MAWNSFPGNGTRSLILSWWAKVILEVSMIIILYFKKLNDIFIILVLYVDDMLIVSKSMDKINRLKAHMARTFDMKDLGREK